jgi:hypothetical protein
MEDTRREAKLRYDWVDDFYEGRAIVRLNGKYGCVNLEGNEVVPLYYDYVDNFSEGRATVILDGKKGVIDLEGNEVIPCWYENIERQSYDFVATYWVTPHDFKYIHFDLDGNLSKEPVGR